MSSAGACSREVLKDGDRAAKAFGDAGRTRSQICSRVGRVGVRAGRHCRKHWGNRGRGRSAVHARAIRGREGDSACPGLPDGYVARAKLRAEMKWDWAGAAATSSARWR